MKKFITIALLMLTMSAQAQVFHAPKTSRSKAAYTDTTTTFKYVTSDEKQYSVFRSKSGALYIWKLSKKSGKLYKMYLPKEIQIKMGRKY